MRKGTILFFVICLLFLPVRAAQTGSIRIRADQMILYPVADPAFAGCGADLANWADPDTARALANFARTKQLPGICAAADETGWVVFGDLPAGIYLLVHPAEGTMEPFLVPIPLRVNGIACYDVEAAPKTAPSHPNTGQPPGLLPWLAVSIAAALGIAALPKSRKPQ